jgi:5-methyltetrahydrofolate--homocysteine methyltransferase
MSRHLYRELLASRTPVIFDGAMGTQIQELGVTETDFLGHAGCNEVLTLSRPDVIIRIHESYLTSGAHVIETNTFGANRVKLAEYGLEGKTGELNSEAAVLARKAVARAGCRHACLVCGTMGPTGILLSSKNGDQKQAGFDEVSSIYREQAAALIDGGVDLLLLETSQDLLELRAAMRGIRRLLRERSLDMPLQVHATMDSQGRMLLGSDAMAFLGAAGNGPCDVIGLNCSTGPAEMKPHILHLLGNSPVPVSMMPNAGMPENINGKAVYKMTPEEFADVMVPLVTQHGLAVTGGCCGTTPGHIRALCAALADKRVGVRGGLPRTFVATAITGKELEQEKKPVIIGERLNAQGSKKTKELVLGRRFDELYQIGIDQAQRGAGLLDLCVAISERDDEAATMASLVSFLSERLSVPFCIDSTEPSVIEAALTACPGAALINSINLEQGGAKAKRILTLAREFSCPVIALTIDEKGMAKTVAHKLDVARRIADLACGGFGLPAHFVYIDPLTFTLATGDAQSADAAKQSLEALFRIREELPGVRTVMGVSNVSYGLSPASRRVLNNLMLHHAMQAGLDAAIFNPLHLDSVDTYDPEVRTAAEDLLFNRRQDALSRFISACGGAPAGPAEMQATTSPRTFEPREELFDKIVRRDRRDLGRVIETLLATLKPQEVLNDILLPAMAEVGERMNRGDMILPFVLQAAEVMKEALDILKPHLAAAQAPARGKIVLATVYGDVHDIGKNLVASILSNQGYEVIDLGKQVSLDQIVEAVRRFRPDAVGLSALLVTTSREMARCVNEFCGLGISVPVIVGGAAVNAEFAARIAKCENGSPYPGGVYYAKDAFMAARILDNMKKNGAPPLPPAQQETGSLKEAGSRAQPPPLEYPEIVVPHFFGTGTVLRWDPGSLLSSIDADRLFKGYFGAGRLTEKGSALAARQEFLPLFDRLKGEILSLGLIEACGLYGIFPVFTERETLVICDPGDFHTPLAQFTFPRVGRKNNRSIADYFRPDGDTIGIQIVTIGRKIDEHCRRYFNEEGKYSLGFTLNAIANYVTELVADKATIEIQRAMVLPRERGRRYSFGYPGLPGIEEQAKLFEILSVEERLGITLTPGFQMNPEHSTMAVFVHHPQAEYL